MDHFEYSNLDIGPSADTGHSSKKTYLVIILGLVGLAFLLAGIIYLFSKKTTKSRVETNFGDIFPIDTKFDGIFVSLADEHSNEFIRPQDNYIEYLSGFTGSFAYIFITRDKKYIMVDSRYYIQVKLEVEGFEILHFEKEDIEKLKTLFKEKIFAYFSNITSVNLHTSLNKLFKTFEPITGFENQLKWNDYVKEQKAVFEKKFAARLNFNYLKKGILSDDLIQQGKVESYRELKNHVLNSGTLTEEDSTSEKLKKIKAAFGANVPDYYLISSLSQIAWILNVRGFDILYTPLIDSYLFLQFVGDDIVTHWYIDQGKINFISKVNLILQVKNIVEKSKFISDLALIKGKKIIIDPSTLNINVYKVASNSNTIEYDNQIVEKLKAVKSKKELERSVIAAKDDSLGFFKIWKYFEELDLKRGDIDEWKFSMHIEEIRSMTPNYLMPSYESIVGAGENGAIVHYEPTEKKNKLIKETDVVLLDSGGQYHGYGTTDVTRVFIKSTLGLDPKVLEDYTFVLKAQISVLRQSFDAENFEGAALDKIVRGVMLTGGDREYEHGTSHGIGMESDVHEGPFYIGAPGKIPNNVIMSDEPGYYREGKWGIRLENDVVSYTLENGEMGLKNLTLICYETKLINKKLLTEDELKFINEYHGTVVSTFERTKNTEPGLLEFIKLKCSELK